MKIIFENETQIILSEAIDYSADWNCTNTVKLVNLGDHATHKIRDTFDEVPDLWKPAELTIVDTRKDEKMELKAEFLYRAIEDRNDDYKRLRTIIRMKNQEQTQEDMRIIFYNKQGIVEEDKIVEASLVKTSRFGFGSKTYDYNSDTRQYVSQAGQVYEGIITTDGILNRVNLLAEQAEKMVVDNYQKAKNM